MTALRFIAKDPNTNGAQCPTAWVDDEAEEIVIQGWNAGQALLDQCREAGPIPATEAVVRVPIRMVPALRKACDVADQLGVR
ncbi:hypothetical protein OG887_19750 [Streptomyces sp. NBC_00053]|nr:hypothetical protein [Streptomyces sp. ADI95-17]MCX4395568.1 hypothetical protein [Streptomyces sp. NBC_01767]MCX5101803.1 hypothetical protein [Streptomyces sp. NBC_00439]MCX5501596.1 hypothetical protein [Streptomyces sp. NBC_00052]MCX5549869.1 hypothetical protein [Streptomyces sp. NBC_00051]WSC33321.1 hypothetical protein OG902_22095 [Streptomyces sp. NBC_01768]WSG55845.1 hypothetical protein OHA38_19815 [Streptomyces sp. NBC_01732]WSX06982.1 hypothetical protein OG355_19950 [Streptom